MQKTVRIICIILCCVMLFQSSVSATSDVSIQPRFTYVNTFSSSISVDEEDCIAMCESKITANGNLSISATCKLQRLVNGVWITIASWSSSKYCVLYMSKSVPVESGYRYRLWVSGTISDSNGSTLEEISKSSYYHYE